MSATTTETTTETKKGTKAKAKPAPASKPTITAEEALAFYQKNAGLVASIPDEERQAFQMENDLKVLFTQAEAIFAKYGVTRQEMGNVILLGHLGGYDLNIPVEDDEDIPARKRSRKADATDEEKAEVKAEGQRLKKALIAHQKATDCTQSSIVKALSKGRATISTGTVRNWLKGEACPRKKFHRRLRSFLGESEPSKG